NGAVLHNVKSCKPTLDLCSEEPHAIHEEQICAVVDGALKAFAFDAAVEHTGVEGERDRPRPADDVIGYDDALVAVREDALGGRRRGDDRVAFDPRSAHPLDRETTELGAGGRDIIVGNEPAVSRGMALTTEEHALVRSAAGDGVSEKLDVFAKRSHSVEEREIGAFERARGIEHEIRDRHTSGVNPDDQPDGAPTEPRAGGSACERDVISTADGIARVEEPIHGRGLNLLSIAQRIVQAGLVGDNLRGIRGARCGRAESVGRLRWSGGWGQLATGYKESNGGQGRHDGVRTHGIPPHRYGTFLIDTFLRGCQERVKRGYCA